MTTVEEMTAYIERTGISSSTKYKYSLCQSEMVAIWELLRTDCFRGIGLLFDYGMAKGYRAAKAEQKAKRKAVR